MTRIIFTDVNGVLILKAETKDESGKTTSERVRFVQDFSENGYGVIEFGNGEKAFINENGDIVKRGFNGITSCKSHGIPYYVVSVYKRDKKMNYYGLIDFELNLVLDTYYTEACMQRIGLCMFNRNLKEDGPLVIVYRNTSELVYTTET